MTFAERVENAALGASVLTWAVLGVASGEPSARASIVRLTITVINLAVGVLFLTRAPIARRATLTALGASVPSMLSGGFAIYVAPPMSQWPRAAELIFAAAGALTVASLLSLGRAFAILPGVRFVVARGPYRWIRHPAYLGELVMVGACGLARADALGLALLAGAIALAVARILMEERLLDETDEYLAYRRNVRFRLLPGLW